MDSGVKRSSRQCRLADLLTPESHMVKARVKFL